MLKLGYRIKLFPRRNWHSSRLFKDTVGLFCLTFLVILPLVCWNLRHTPYEVFFRRDENLEKKMLIAENQERVKQSIAILNQTYFNFGFSAGYNSGHLKQSIPSANNMFQTEGDPQEYKFGIAVTIITVSRNKNMVENYRPNYLVQSVAAFLQILNQTSDDIPVHFSVCNVDNVPRSHTDMNYVPKWVTVFQRYMKDDRKKLNYNALLDKEKEDYVFCLQKALEQNMTFSLLVEDDTLPRSDFFRVIKAKISSVIYHERRRNSMENVLFVKLYHPERLLGFISLEYERLPELFSLSIVLTGILVRIYTKWRPNIKTNKLKIGFIFLVYSVCILMSIGRQNIIQIRRFTKHLYQITPAPSCCTPAMLFPNVGGRIVTEYLKTVKCRKGFGKDYALEKLLETTGYKSRMIQPNLFQHIGHFSSLRSGFINSFLVR